LLLSLLADPLDVLVVMLVGVASDGHQDRLLVGLRAPGV
jgi:hypothetical protein